MLALVLISTACILLCVGGCFLCKYKIKTEKGKYIILLVASCLTILCHYSSIVYHLIVDKECMSFLTGNPNLILPIYPCNLVMIICLLYGIKKDKEDGFAKWMADYIFFFGVVSCLVGMFANVDFIRDLAENKVNYDDVKSVVAHGFMLFNVLLLPFLGYVKVNLPRNMLNLVISIVMMALVGLHITAIFAVVANWNYAYSVNSMFLLHSPFDGVDFIKYPFIAGLAVVFYFSTLCITELFVYKKGNRWYNRLARKEF